LSDERFDVLVTDGVHATLIRSVVNQWLQRPGISADRPLLFSLRHKLPAGREIARRVIESRSRRPDVGWSLMWIAAHGDASDLPLVESLLSADTVLWPPRGQAVTRVLPDRELPSTYTVEIRDVALLVALHLRQIEFEEFGLRPAASEVTVFRLESLGFDSAESRQAALTRYQDQIGPTSQP
jgi:hypothetical protein